MVLPLNHISSLHLMTESSVFLYLNTFSMILILICINAHSFKYFIDLQLIIARKRLDFWLLESKQMTVCSNNIYL